MDNKLIITQEQLDDTVEKAVNIAVEDVKKEMEKKENPFAVNFIESKKEENPAYVGAYANAVIHAKKTGNSLEKSANLLMEKNKSYASEVVAKGLYEGSAVDGGYLVIPEVYNQFIELVKAQSLIRSLPGVQQISMSSGSLLINRETTGAGAYWNGEIPGAVTENGHKYGRYTLTPKDLYSWTTISKSLIADSYFNIEQQVQNSIIKQVAITEDAAFLAGTGSSYQPKGIYNWLNASNKISSGGVTTELYEADFFSAELAIRGQNHMDDLYWAMNWATYSALRTKLRVTTGIVAWPELREAEPMLLGYPVKFTNTTSNPSSKIYLLNPSDFLIADRVGLEFTVDPIQNDSNFPVSINETLILAHSRVDCVLLHDTSSAVIE